MDDNDEFDEECKRRDSSMLRDAVYDIAQFFERRAGKMLIEAFERDDVADIEDQLAWLATQCLAIRQNHTLKNLPRY